MAETRLTEHVTLDAGNYVWREDGLEWRACYDKPVSTICELAQALLAERERVARLAEAIARYGRGKAWYYLPYSGLMVGEIAVPIEEDARVVMALLEADRPQQALREDGEG